MAESLSDPKDPNHSIDSVIEDYSSSGIPDKKSAHIFAGIGALYLILLSIPLIAFPRFLVLLLGPTLLVTEGVEDESSKGSGQPQVLRTLNGLELYLGRLVGLSFITLAIILILQTGAIPLTTSLAHDHSKEESAPYRQPTVFFVTVFFGLLGFSSWNVGLTVIGLSGSALAAWGTFVFLFAVGNLILTCFRFTDHWIRDSEYDTLFPESHIM
ncbi:uncharacterized protein MELLADRAFT_107022 [Melampsora larici-populina 98AG31]|uniref:Transmembrane protein n=1 Tax=Melampsora larici-populina (strain 98AG31 / pathotype 3-4-7) TaxID=747676 RepID=F4RNE8_MELLP|nr:uncharacterized protein MELLADRAFT_107022 [Melampsora larici-populina 98AG31]EGG05976.1 hypothetical protein MELLADRAFT_107022 [Melampsora larici-populina 98AG31]